MKQIQVRVLLILLLASALINLLDRQKILDYPKGFIQYLLVPVEEVFMGARNGVIDTFSVVTFWKSGEARVKNLELRNAELLAQTNSLKALQSENDNLRQQLGVKAMVRYRQLPAEVLGVGRNMEIKAGTGDGVKAGQTVAMVGNLVGRILEVGMRTSTVELPSDADSKIPVKIGLLTQGLVEGQFNSSIIVSHVAQNEDLNVGDLVVTSGEGQSYIPGLTVGKIAKINSKDTDLFRQADVVPLVDYRELTTVFVILD